MTYLKFVCFTLRDVQHLESETLAKDPCASWTRVKIEYGTPLCRESPCSVMSLSNHDVHARLGETWCQSNVVCDLDVQQRAEDPITNSDHNQNLCEANSTILFRPSIDFIVSTHFAQPWDQNDKHIAAFAGVPIRDFGRKCYNIQEIQCKWLIRPSSVKDLRYAMIYEPVVLPIASRSTKWRQFLFHCHAPECPPKNVHKSLICITLMYAAVASILWRNQSVLLCEVKSHYPTVKRTRNSNWFV